MPEPTNPVVPERPIGSSPGPGYQAGSPTLPANPAPHPAAPPMPYGSPQIGSLGKIRSTGMCIFLAVITFGIYQLVWWYKTHDEMKRHSGQGMGGGLALVLSIFVGIVMPYISSSEVGSLYERAGLRKPVGGATGLWYFPGVFILVGPLVWFIKTNGALNAYWRAQGVR
ncbi:hypothetical protein GCM10027020_22650 [Nocardioides salsibiostraticola]